MNDAHLWHAWLRINRLLRVVLHTRWSAEACPLSVLSSGVHSRCGVRSGARAGSIRLHSTQRGRLFVRAAALVHVVAFG
jgi:hypothetical protein